MENLTLFPLYQTTCFFIPLVAPCTPLLEKRGEDFYLISGAYHLDIKITDDEVMTAAINGLYISAFISRKDDNYRVHFLVHQYPDQMKARFEEEITKDVVDYMIYGTIMALRLDTPEKVNAYLGI